MDDIEIDLGTAPTDPAPATERAPNPLDPAPYELKALEAFKSKDETRPFVSTVWAYSTTDGFDPETCAPRVVGRTHVATSGHVLCCRRSGAHAKMSAEDVAMLPPTPLSGVRNIKPPAWAIGCHAYDESKGLSRKGYGVNPTYVGLVALVEKAAVKRQLAALPKAATRELARLRERATLGACSSWRIPSDPLDPWYWRIDLGDVLWEGCIMPRRL